MPARRACARCSRLSRRNRPSRANRRSRSNGRTQMPIPSHRNMERSNGSPRSSAHMRARRSARVQLRRSPADSAPAAVEPRHDRPLSTSALRRPRSVADDQLHRNWSRNAQSPHSRQQLHLPAREQRCAAIQAGETPLLGAACGYSLVRRKRRIRINQPRVNKRLRINKPLPMKFERTKMSLVISRSSGPDNYNSCACPGSIGTKRTGMRLSR